jgi:hypothetical protein
MSSVGEAKSMVMESVSVFGTIVDFVYVRFLDQKNLSPSRIADEIRKSSDDDFKLFVLSKLGFRLDQDDPVLGLSECNVAKRAVMQMLMYGRLQSVRSAKDVSGAQQSLFSLVPAIVEPSLQMFGTVGDYLVSEMLVTSSAIRHVHSLTQKHAYLNPMRIRNTYVDSDDASFVLELLFMRLMRHLVAFNEGLMEAIGYRTRFMMSLTAAEHFASRSLAYEKGHTVNRRPPSLTAADIAAPQEAPPAADAATERFPLLLKKSLTSIAFEPSGESGQPSGEPSEVQDLTGIKRLYARYAEKWTRQAELFFKAPLEKEMHRAYLPIIKGLQKAVSTPMDPTKAPFERIHNRAALAVEVAQQLIEIYWVKVCDSDEDTITSLQDKMKVCLNNSSLYAEGIFVPKE